MQSVFGYLGIVPHVLLASEEEIGQIQSTEHHLLDRKELRWREIQSSL